MRSRARIGHPLPNATRAYAAREKWLWILGPAGHGGEWQRVFHAELEDRHTIWAAIVMRLPKAPVVRLRSRGAGELVCGVVLPLTVNARRALVLTAWHYAETGSAPRLVTAYPIGR